MPSSAQVSLLTVLEYLGKRSGQGQTYARQLHHPQKISLATAIEILSRFHKLKNAFT